MGVCLFLTLFVTVYLWSTATDISHKLNGHRLRAVTALENKCILD